MFTHGHLDMEAPFHLHVLNVRPHSRVVAKVGAPDKVPPPLQAPSVDQAASPTSSPRGPDSG